MPSVPLYRQGDNRAKLLSALRGGASKGAAGELIGASLATMLGWIDRDPVFASEVDQAETMARSSGATPSATPAPATADPKGDRWARIREEAAKLAPGMLGLLLYVDGILAARPGAFALSPYDRWSLGDWYASGKPVYLARKGRGAGKSMMQIKVVATECIFGERQVPPGETWIWPFLSFDMSESNLKVGPLEHALTALGYGPSSLAIHRRKDGRTTIAFDDDRGQSIEVRVYPNTVTAMSGPTLAGATNDEEAKWKADKDKGLNSAEDVLDAMAGAFRGDVKNKKHMRISSAYQTRGPHYDDIEAGDTELHYVARLGPFVDDAIAGFELVASRLAAEGRESDAAKIRAYARTLTPSSANIPSWIPNPTHDIWGGFLRLRKRVTQWLRENGSVSTADGDDDGDFFDAARVEAAAAALDMFAPDGAGECFAAIDPGSRNNAFAIAIVRKVCVSTAARLSAQLSGRPLPATVYLPVVLREWIPTPGYPLDLRMVVLPEAAAICEAHGVTRWVTDAHALTDVEIVGAEHGISTRCRAEGEAYELEYRPVRDALHRGELSLSGCDGVAELARQLRMVRSAAGNAGHIRMIHPEDGALHGDLQRAYVSACADAGAGAPEPPTGSGITTLPGRYSRADPRRR